MKTLSFVIKDFFLFLEKTGVDYCVMGNTIGLPDYAPSDIDIVVSEGKLSLVTEKILGFCDSHGIKLVQLIRHEQSAIYFVIAWLGENGLPCFFVPDICEDYYRNGKLLLKSQEIIASRTPALDQAGAQRGFYIASPAINFIYYLVKRIDKKSIDLSHGSYLSQLWKSDQAGAERQIQKFWKDTDYVQSISQAAQNDRWENICAQVVVFRSALHKAIKFNFSDFYNELRRKINRIIHPTGLMIAFLGPDGSGKSSVISAVKQSLKPLFRRVQYIHLRVRWRKGNTDVLPVTDPYQKSPRNNLLSTLKIFYFLFNYVMGHITSVKPALIKSTLVIFDRYYHDILADSRRYRYGGPRGLARLISKFIPKPDLWLVLDAPAEILQSRKNEVSWDESESQRQAYLKLMKYLDHGIKLDSSLCIEEVVKNTNQAVIDYLALRIKKRHYSRIDSNPLAARILLFLCHHRIPVISKLYRIFLGSDIYCKINFPFSMPHPYGIVIHSKTQIGMGVTIMQQVTLGGKNKGGNVAPIIESDVYIGAGAKVLGEVRIGRGAVIGANAVITKDVSANTTVVGANRIIETSDTQSLKSNLSSPILIEKEYENYARANISNFK